MPTARRILATALLTLAVPASASAATVSPGQSIQSAIDGATAGDTITIQAGTYTEVVSTAKNVILDAAPGTLLVNPAAATGATLTFTGTAGETVKGLIVLSTVANAVQVGGGTTLIQRSQFISTAKGPAISALAANSGTGDPAKTITVDSSILIAPRAISASYTSPTVAGAGITVNARHVTAIGSTVADTTGAPTLGATGIAITYLDSLIRGTRVPATGTGTADATITADPARNSVADTAGDAGTQFVRASGFNYHLRADAPVIDKGQLTNGESATDIDGDPRTSGSTTDYGADEFVNKAPTAVLTGPTGSVRQNVAATFSAAKSTDPESATGGGIGSYHWDFGDGSTADTTTPTTTHAFADRKDYSVTVTVTDKQGLASAASSPVAVKVLDGTAPTLTVGVPKSKQKIKLYKTKRSHGKLVRTKKRLKVSFFGSAADDTQADKVVLALRPVATSGGKCRWFDGKSKLVAGSCTQPILLTPTFVNGGWRYSLPLKAKLPRGPYQLVAASVDSSGLSSTVQTITFRFT